MIIFSVVPFHHWGLSLRDGYYGYGLSSRVVSSLDEEIHGNSHSYCKEALITDSSNDYRLQELNKVDIQAAPSYLR